MCQPWGQHEITMYYTYHMILLFSNFLLCSMWLCDCMTVTVTMSSDVTDVWQCDHNVTLTLTLDPRIKKRKGWEKEKEKEN